MYTITAKQFILGFMLSLEMFVRQNARDFSSRIKFRFGLGFKQRGNAECETNNDPSGNSLQKRDIYSRTSDYRKPPNIRIYSKNAINLLI